MSTRPVDWSPLHLSTDPVPGNADAITDYAHRFSSVASDIGIASTQLRNILAEDSAVSEYVDEIRGLADEVSDRIGRVKDRYNGAAGAVRTYGYALKNAQDAADGALAAARDGASTAHYATTLIMRYEEELAQPGITAEDKDRYERLKKNAEDDLRDAQAASGGAQTTLQSAISARNAAAQTAIDALADVQAAGDLNDSGWDDFAQWWTENQDLIDAIVTIIGIIAAVVTVILLCIPGVNAIVLIIIGIVAAAIAIANAMVGMAVGTKSVAQGILEIALSLIPFRLGGIAGAAARTVEGQAIKTVMASWTARGATHFTAENAAALVQSTIKNADPTLLQRLLTGNAQELAGIQGIRDLTVSGAPQVFNEVVQSQVWKYMLEPNPFIGELIGPLVDQLHIPEHVGDVLDWELPPAEKW